MVVLTLVGITSALAMGRFNKILVQYRVSRAASVVRNDLEAAFAVSVRNRRPIEITWDSTARQLSVTDRAGTLTYRHTSLGQDPYGLKGTGVKFSRSSLEVYPNGMANDTLRITFSTNGYTKLVRMTRTGMLVIK
jgi:Tfp pilus assembly protein FimT